MLISAWQRGLKAQLSINYVGSFAFRTIKTQKITANWPFAMQIQQNEIKVM